MKGPITVHEKIVVIACCEMAKFMSCTFYSLHPRPCFYLISVVCGPFKLLVHSALAFWKTPKRSDGVLNGSYWFLIDVSQGSNMLLTFINNFCTFLPIVKSYVFTKSIFKFL